MGFILKIYLFIEIVSSFLFGLPAFAEVFPSDSAQTSRPAVFHLHEALIGVSHVVRAADGVVLTGADTAAAGKHKLEVLQALGHGSHVDVLTEKKRENIKNTRHEIMFFHLIVFLQFFLL